MLLLLGPDHAATVALVRELAVGLRALGRRAIVVVERETAAVAELADAALTVALAAADAPPAAEARLEPLTALITQRFAPAYAVAIGPRSHRIAASFATTNLPLLVHLSSGEVGTPPAADLYGFYAGADILLFSGEEERQAFKRSFPRSGLQEARVLPPPDEGAGLAQALDRAGQDAIEKRRRLQAGAWRLLSPENFEAELYFNARVPAAGRAELVRAYQRDTWNFDFAAPLIRRTVLPRPLPGFNAFSYAGAYPAYPRGRADPLLHYLQQDRPPGPWRHPVLELGPGDPAPASTALKVAIHGHFFYDDLIDEFLSALGPNRSPIDLFLTTGSAEAAGRLAKATAAYEGGRVSIEMVENVGRDIAPFISLLERLSGDYDVVGHVHGKKSLHLLAADAEFGQRWRRQLWSHLLGPETAVADRILSAFASDPELGLVFPESGGVVGWEDNREEAERLRPRLGLDPLPEHIDFPVGTMFWARPAAVEALVDARFQPRDYPAEPLADDGTVLHALERLLPLVAESAGFSWMTTYRRPATA